DAQGVAIERSLLSSREILERPCVARARTLDEKLNFAVWRPGQGAVVVTDGLKSLANQVEERKKKVVVIGEDDEPIAVLLRDAISHEPGYQAVDVADAARVREPVARAEADLLLT